MPTLPPPKTTATLLLVTGMLVSGVCNTILNKYQDMQCVGNCDDPDPSQRRYFEQPVWQTLNMFVGETAVWLVYLAQLWQRRRAHQQRRNGATLDSADSAKLPPSAVNQLDASAVVDDARRELRDTSSAAKRPIKGAKVFLFWIPTLCDLTATTVMNVGLILTSASVYQMLRGAVVIFTGIFSCLFLNRRLRMSEWVSLVLVVTGVGIVGLSSVLFPQRRPATSNSDGSDDVLDTSSLLGVFLVLGAQLFTATQFVVEEKIMEHYNVTSLKAVGLEGSFGLVSVLGAMPILHVLFARQSISFDIRQGFHDFFDYPAVWQTGVAISISIAFFNWFGLSITKAVSATARSTIDACRTLFIWMVSLYLGWEQFSWVQVIGFVVMVLGTFFFNGVLHWPFEKKDPEEEGERAPLLQQES